MSKQLSDVETRSLKRLLDKGWSYGELSERFSVSRDQIQEWADKLKHGGKL